MPSTTVDEFRSHIAGLLASPEWRHPVAFGIGIASLSASDPDKILDTYYGVVNLDENQGFAALVADIVGHDGSTGTVRLNEQHLQSTRDILAPAIDDGGSHPNAELLPALAGVFESPVSVTGTRKVPVITFIGSLENPPSDVHDAYLRLHLLSHRKVRPNCLNLDGVFGLLENVVWTSLGPCDSAGFEITRTRLRALGNDINVFGLDKFPRMVDYVIPSGVRIADADRVRLGAHLAEGTTVMHEGFVNFNAGTLGNAMVEGRISSGVVVGANSDIGGGASIMGTLSGGGKEVVAVGERCLIGANGGTGISLGDGCTIEAGLYVTAGTKVTLPDGSIVKARDLSGRDSLLFRRSSTTGVVEVLPTSGSWEGLNVALHSNT